MTLILAASIHQATPPTDTGLIGLIEKLDPIWAVFIWVFIMILIPFVRDKIYPDMAASRKASVEKAEKATDRQLAMQEKFIDTLHAIQLAQNALAVRIEHLGETFHVAETERAQARAQEAQTILLALSIIKEDLAAIYGKIDEPRPSRRRPS